jgi:hypothetical protein
MDWLTAMTARLTMRLPARETIFSAVSGSNPALGRTSLGPSVFDWKFKLTTPESEGAWPPLAQVVRWWAAIRQEARIK